MAVNSSHRRSFNRMQVVRSLQERETPSAPVALVGAEAAPSSSSSSSPTPSASSSSTPQVASNLPTSVKALTGFIVVMGVLILAIAAWRIGVWRRRKRLAASKTVGVFVPGGEKATIHITRTSTDSADMDEKFNFVVPNVAALTPPEKVHSLNKAVKKGTNRFLGAFSPKSSASSEVPSPNYNTAVPTPSTAPSNSPPASAASKVQLTVEVPHRPPTSPHATVALNLPLPTGTPAPVPSPRTSSYGPASPLYKTPATARLRTGKKLPRLMVVTCTFVPQLTDELPVRLGETLRLVEEYEDEWCLVQRIGKSDAEKGVIPRFCLQERQDVIAALRK